MRDTRALVRVPLEEHGFYDVACVLLALSRKQPRRHVTAPRKLLAYATYRATHVKTGGLLCTSQSGCQSTERGYKGSACGILQTDDGSARRS